MKKLILIVFTITVIITTLVICVSARNEDNYTYVMQFNETEKAYPIMNTLEDAIGFKSYYMVDNLRYNVYSNDDVSQLQVTYNYDTISFTYFGISANYPTYDFRLTDVSYDDIGFINELGTIYLVTITDGVATKYDNFDMISDGNTDGFIYLTNKDNMLTDYYVQFPVPVTTPSEPYTVPILESLGEFVSGIGVAFGSAFTTVFLVNGQPNAFAIVLLIFFGLALGYGIVRFVVTLFRKEAN